MTSIRQAFSVLWRAVYLLWDNLLTFTTCNLLWLVLCLPIVTAPAAFAGLYHVADMAARERPVKPTDFFEGFRQYFLRATLLGVLNLLALFVIYGNFIFYQEITLFWGRILQAIWMAVGLFWAILQVYLLPMLIVQIEPKIWWAIRNSVMLVLAQPIFTFAIVLFILLILTLSLSLILPLFAITMSLIGLLCSTALYDRLSYVRAKQESWQESDPPADED